MVPAFLAATLVLPTVAVAAATNDAGELSVTGVEAEREEVEKAEREEIEEAEREEIEERRADEAALNEDPEEQRRATAQPTQEDELPGAADDQVRNFTLDLYGSARVHAIDTFDIDTGERKSRFGDGNSRAGVRADWQYRPGWWLIARTEVGLDLVESFTTRGDLIGDGGLTARLAYAGLDHEQFTLVAGRNWSAYYQVAGITDRFAIFGGSASGVYNAGTAGQQAGTGRAEDVIQAKANVYPGRLAPRLKPFKLNVQYQLGQPIPQVDGVKYDYSFGASAFLETQKEFGLGIAYNRARVPSSFAGALTAAGIDGDSEALAMSTRAFGTRWYISLLVTRLENMETTDEGRYFDGKGLEIYGQWQVKDRWWLIGGYNSLDPDADDADAGEFRTRYTVAGARYTFRSFERMAYFEYRIDNSRLASGAKGKDEITIGIRWDFDY